MLSWAFVELAVNALIVPRTFKDLVQCNFFSNAQHTIFVGMDLLYIYLK